MLVPITETEAWNYLHLEQTLSAGDMVGSLLNIKCSMVVEADISESAIVACFGPEVRAGIVYR